MFGVAQTLRGIKNVQNPQQIKFCRLVILIDQRAFAGDR